MTPTRSDLDGTWPADDELRAVAVGVEAAFLALPGEGPFGDVPEPLFGVELPNLFVTRPDEVAERPLAGDAEPFLVLHPGRIAEAYDQVTVARGKHEHGEMGAMLDRLDSRLNTWHGEARDAFAAKQSHLRAFVDGQIGYYAEVQLRLAVGYKIGVLARQNLLAIGEWMLASIERYREQREAQNTEYVTAVVVGVTQSAGGTRAPTSLAEPLVLATAAAIGETAKTVMKEIGTDQLIELGRAYRERWTAERTAVEQELDALARAFTDLQNRLLDTVDENQLFTPIEPRHADVRSPDFSYEAFGFNHDDGGAGARVPDAVRAREVETPSDPESSIRRALDG